MKTAAEMREELRNDPRKKGPLSKLAGCVWPGRCACEWCRWDERVYDEQIRGIEAQQDAEDQIERAVMAAVESK